MTGPVLISETFTETSGRAALAPDLAAALSAGRLRCAACGRLPEGEEDLAALAIGFGVASEGEARRWTCWECQFDAALDAGPDHEVLS